jgi:hypothetical protein
VTAADAWRRWVAAEMAAAVVAAVMAEAVTTIRTAKEAAESARRRSREAAMEAVEAGGARCTAKAHVEEVVEHLILRRRAGLVSAHAGGAGRGARCFAGGAGSGRCAYGRAAHRQHRLALLNRSRECSN